MRHHRAARSGNGGTRRRARPRTPSSARTLQCRSDREEQSDDEGDHCDLRSRHASAQFSPSTLATVGTARLDRQWTSFALTGYGSAADVAAMRAAGFDVHL